MRYTISILVFFILLSCKQATDKQVETIDSNETPLVDSISIVDTEVSVLETNELDYLKVDTGIKKDLATYGFDKLIKANLIRWTSFYENLSKNFMLQEFRNFNTRVIQPYQVPLGDKDSQIKFFRLYKPYLVWSPDSTRAIDLYSYTYILDYNAEGNIYGLRDVDNQLALIDLKKQKRIILMTYGPIAEFQDAFWINNNSIIITWIEYIEEDTFNPHYSLIDLKTFLMRDYKMASSLKLSDNRYIDIIFKEVKFK